MTTTQRSETVTTRLTPKLRYMAELAARKHRRSLSGFIEWAIESSLQETDPVPLLLEALQPFVERTSSEDTITITVRTSDVARARAAISAATGAQS